ncbi:MAG: PfkB family carbohydrate kinase [Gammaproteobacteria bacterium]
MTTAVVPGVAAKTVLCIGHAVQDHVYRLSRLPVGGSKNRATGFTSVGGGPAATAAVAIARLGGRARLAARVGDDAVAGELERELRGHGVDCAALRRFAGRSSSRSAVFVDDAGERMIVNHTDPAMPADPAWLAQVDLAGVDAVLVDVRWPEGAALMLARARAAGLPAVLDADVPLPPGSALPRAATHVAFSLPGLRDHLGLAADAPLDADACAAALQRIARETGAWCAVTMGAGGVLYARGDTGAGADAGAAPRVSRSPAFRVTAVDTLGAGDVWHGAFALALAEGGDETAAVRAASAAAAIKVTRLGGRAGAPTRAERDALLSSTAGGA